MRHAWLSSITGLQNIFVQNLKSLFWIVTCICLNMYDRSIGKDYMLIDFHLRDNFADSANIKGTRMAFSGMTCPAFSARPSFVR